MTTAGDPLPPNYLAQHIPDDEVSFFSGGQIKIYM
jgi:hypothetical protein